MLLIAPIESAHKQEVPSPLGLSCALNDHGLIEYDPLTRRSQVGEGGQEHGERLAGAGGRDEDSVSSRLDGEQVASLGEAKRGIARKCLAQMRVDAKELDALGGGAGGQPVVAGSRTAGHSAWDVVPWRGSVRRCRTSGRLTGSC